MPDTRAEKPASPAAEKTAPASKDKTNAGESKPDFLRRVNMLPFRKQTLETGFAAVNAAADIIKSLHVPAAAASPPDDLQKALVNVLVSRLTADPLEGFGAWRP